MSREIESRVVEMSFENDNFERNAKQSLSTLDKLKSALNFGKFSDFSPVENGIEKVTIAFDKMQIVAIAAITNIANRITNTFVSAVKGMSVDQISAGWSKFAEVTTSTQTIISATGKDIDTVSNAVARLNWFTDETSYSLTDMTNNIGKFTSAGVDLDKSVNAMQGVATWAALSGANTGEASRAMYNLSQAMGSGAMLAIDWRSIENANMATREFKETAIQTARDMGVLTISNEKAAEMVNNFRDTLSDKWFTGDVLTKTLEKYGGYATRLGEITEELGDLGYETTGQWNKAIDQYVKLTKDSTEETGTELRKFMAEQAEETGLSVEELTKYFKELGAAEYDLGRKAFKAAQEAKTFQEVLDATKDAVSTGWMNTFQNIFGNYEEAKQIWSELADRMWELFAAGIDRRNNILKAWRESGDWAYIFGNPDRDGGEMYGALWNILDAVQTVKDAIDDAFGTLDPDRLHNFSIRLWEISDLFNIFAERIAPDVTSVLGDVKIVFNSVRDTITAVIEAVMEDSNGIIKPFEDGQRIIFGMLSPLKLLSKYIDRAREFLVPVVETVTADIINFFNAFKKSKVVQNTLHLIDTIIRTVGTSVSNLVGRIQENETISNFITNIREKMLGLPDVLADVIAKVDEFIRTDFGSFLSDVFNYLSKIPDAIGRIWEKLQNVKILQNIRNILSDIPGKLASIREKITGIFQNLNLQDFTSKIQNGGLGGLAAVGVIGANLGIGTVLKNLFSGFGNIGDLVAKVQSVVDAITAPISTLMDTLKGMFGKKEESESFDVSAMKQFSISIAILAASLIVLSSVDAERLKTSLGALTILFGEMLGMFAILNKIVNSPIQTAITEGVEKPTGLLAKVFGERNPIKKANINSTMKALIAVTAGVLILSISMSKLASMDMGKMLVAFLVITALLGEMTLVVQQLASVNVSGNSLKQFAGTFVGLGFALLLIGLSMKAIGSLDYGKIATSVAAVGLLIFLMCEMTRKMLEYGGIFGTAVGVAFTLIAIATSVILLTVPLMVLAFLPWERLLQGVISITVLMGLLTGCVLILSKFAKDAGVALAGGAAAFLIAMSIGVIVAVLLPLSMLNWGALAKMGVSLLVVLGLLVLAMRLMTDPFVLIGAAALLVASGALLVIAIALQKLSVALLALSAIGGGNVLGILAALGGGFIVLALGLVALTAGIVGAVVLIMIANSTLKLAEALLILSMVPIGKLLADILILAAGMEVFGLVCITLSQNFLKLLVGAAAVVIISAAVIAFAVALGILAVSITLTVIALFAFVEAVLIVVSTISNLLNGCFEVGNFPAIKNFGTNLFGSLKESTQGIWGKVKSFFGKKGNEIGEAVTEGTTESLDEGEPEVKNTLDEWVATAGYTGEIGIESFTSGFTGTGMDVPEELASYIDGDGDLGKLLNSYFYKDGKYADEGLAKGIADYAYKATDAAEVVAGKVNNVTAKTFQIESPSKLFRQYGMYLDEGLALGIDDKAGMVEDSAVNMAYGATSLSGILAGVVDSINESDMSSPVIRPVLDLSEIQNGASRIGGMFGSSQWNVTGAYDMAQRAYIRRPSVEKEPVVQTNSTPSSAFTNNFYITGNNPDQIAEVVSAKLRNMVTSINAKW